MLYFHDRTLPLALLCNMVPAQHVHVHVHVYTYHNSCIRGRSPAPPHGITIPAPLDA